MKLLIHTQYYPPEMGAPQARLSELAKRLKAMGHEITVLTAMPNYPVGKVFDGYKWKIRKTETIDGIRVCRVCLFASRSKRILPRLASYISFGITSVLLGIWGLGRHDVMLIESPPPFLVPFGWLLGKLVGAKPVMMVADIWPYQLVAMGMVSEGPGLRLCNWLEAFSYNHCYAVATTNPGASRHIQERFPHLKNITVISNGVDTKFFRHDLRSDEMRSSIGVGPEDFLVGYCGLHGTAQGLEVVLQAAEKLKNQKNIKFVMVGDGPCKEELMKMAEDLNLENLKFLERRPKSDMPKIVASFDTSLMPLVVRLRGVMPSKVYEALASGVPPIVAKGCEGEALVKMYEVGECYEPADAGELAQAILRLASDRERWHRLCKNAIELSKKFDRDISAENTEQIFNAIIEGDPLPKVRW